MICTGSFTHNDAYKHTGVTPQCCLPFHGHNTSFHEGDIQMITVIVPCLPSHRCDTPTAMAPTYRHDPIGVTPMPCQWGWCPKGHHNGHGVLLPIPQGQGPRWPIPASPQMPKWSLCPTSHSMGVTYLWPQLPSNLWVWCPMSNAHHAHRIVVIFADVKWILFTRISKHAVCWWVAHVWTHYFFCLFFAHADPTKAIPQCQCVFCG